MSFAMTRTVPSYVGEEKAIIEKLFAGDFEHFGYPLRPDSELLDN